MYIIYIYYTYKCMYVCTYGGDEEACVKVTLLSEAAVWRVP